MAAKMAAKMAAIIILFYFFQICKFFRRISDPWKCKSRHHNCRLSRVFAEHFMFEQNEKMASKMAAKLFFFYFFEVENVFIVFLTHEKI